MPGEPIEQRVQKRRLAREVVEHACAGHPGVLGDRLADTRRTARLPLAGLFSAVFGAGPLGEKPGWRGFRMTGGVRRIRMPDRGLATLTGSCVPDNTSREMAATRTQSIA